MTTQNYFKIKNTIQNLPSKFSWKNLNILLLVWLLYGFYDLFFLQKWTIFVENWQKGNTSTIAHILDFSLYFPSRWIIYFIIILLLNLILFIFVKKSFTYWKLINLTDYAMTWGFIVKFILTSLIFFIFPIQFQKLESDFLFVIIEKSVYVIAIILFFYGLLLRPKIAPIK